MQGNNYMMSVDDVRAELSVSKGKAYELIRTMNNELAKMGYMVVSGKVPRAYWNKRFYNEEAQ